MAGLEEPDEGSVTKANHVVVRFLSQQPEFRPEDTILESVLRGNKKSGGQTAGGAQEEDWEMESQAKSMLTRLGVTDFSQKCGELSGGQKKRLALVAALLTPADILILDEPTNHLDNNMADWLEDFLLKWKGAVVMVTHDRYFLDSVATRIIEIDKGSIYSYQSNYEGYLSLKAEREEMQAASERKRQSILRNELAWMQRGARARSTKQKARIQRYEELKGMDGPAAGRPCGYGIGFLTDGAYDPGAFPYQQGLWDEEADRGFFLYFPEKRTGGLYRPQRLRKNNTDENSYRAGASRCRAGGDRADHKNRLLCPGNCGHCRRDAASGGY